MTNQNINKLIAGQSRTMSVENSDFRQIEPDEYHIPESRIPIIRKWAITTAEEIRRRSDEFLLNKAQLQAIRRIWMNNTRERWKNLNLRDMAAIARIGRIYQLIPNS